MDERAEPQGKLNRQVHEAGAKARAAGKGRDDHPDYQRRSLVSDWQRGWDEAAPMVRVQEPEVRVAVVEVATRNPRAFWPADKPMPETYQRQRRLVPCPKCTRVLMDDGGQVAVVRTIYLGIVYLRCRQVDCRNEWKLSVET